MDLTHMSLSDKNLDNETNLRKESTNSLHQTTQPMATILIVDDDLYSLKILAQMLTFESYTVKTVTNGEEALISLQNHPFDMVLLDLGLPDISGKEVLAKVKVTENFKHIPVIMISGSSESDQIAECIALGATDYLVKPFNLIILKARIKSSLATKHLYDLEMATQEAVKAALTRNRTLYQIAHVLVAYKNIPNLLNRLTQEIADVLPADRAILHVLDTQKQEITHFAGGGPGWAIVESFSSFSLLMEGLIGWALSNQKTTLYNAGEYDGRVSEQTRQMRKKLDIGSIVVIPIPLKGSVVSTLTVINRHDQTPFGVEDVELLEALSQLVSMAIQNVDLYEAEQQAQEMLVRQNQELDAFAGTVAHDLKNSLVAISGLVQLILLNGESVEKCQRQARKLLEMTDYMKTTVDELLLLARIRKEDVTVEVVGMALIIFRVQKRLSSLIQEYNAQIIVPAPHEWHLAWGYGAWIEEVWYNYINNAIKYGGAPPYITVGSSWQDDYMIRFWVQDNGNGISAKHQKGLFMPFNRFSEEQTEGQGLGLSIVERIITKLGGKVGVKSSEGEGSTFWFTLPAYLDA